MSDSNKHNSIFDSRYLTGLYIPLLVILTVIALATSLQTFFFMFGGPYTFFNMFRFVISKLLFASYYLFLALALHELSRYVFLSDKIKLQWYLIHILGIPASLILHQLLIREVDSIVFVGYHYPSFYQILFKNTLVWFDISAYVFLLLIFQWMEYREKIIKNNIRFADLEMSLMNSKIRELRTKLHPVFLFRTFSSISEMISLHRNNDANRILSLLSDFLRTTVYESDREFIPFRNELKFLNQYLAIEKIRLEGRLCINQEIDENTMDVNVPNFFLQPVTEDLIAEPRVGDNDYYNLSVFASVTNEFLGIIIQINSPGSALRNSENIKITGERILRLYNNKSSFTCSSAESNGSRIMIKLPLNYKYQNEAIPFKEESVL
jgi:sensor histidine kinase YesM